MIWSTSRTQAEARGRGRGEERRKLDQTTENENGQVALLRSQK